MPDPIVPERIVQIFPSQGSVSRISLYIIISCVCGEMKNSGTYNEPGSLKNSVWARYSSF
jgi:hypothetical protein